MNRPGYDLKHLRPMAAADYKAWLCGLAREGFSKQAVFDIAKASKEVTVDGTSEKLVLVPTTWA